VLLDVSTNHIGPEGNYLARSGHTFLAESTPRRGGGRAQTTDDADSDEVPAFARRHTRFFGSRSINRRLLPSRAAGSETSARNMLEELTEAVHAQGDG